MLRQKRAYVGVCGRNDHHFQPADYELVKAAEIECLKMMSFTVLGSFAQLFQENPSADFIVRLYDGRFGKGERHPSPSEFADTFVPIMDDLAPYADKFEIHNEPNHLHGIEGWGQEDRHAHDFNDWFLWVHDLLKSACPWAELGFPGLAIPHRDLEWVEICRPAVEKADWLGVHCYWQNPTASDCNHLADFWGLRFKFYHDKFPDKPIEVTEFGNSNCQSGFPVDWDKITKEYVEFYQEMFKYPYVRSASAFIMSAPQRKWQEFCWRREDGYLKGVVEAVGNMPRPPLFREEMPEPPPDPEPPPELGDPIVGMARPPERITLPSGRRRDLAFCVGVGPWERGAIKVEWAYGYRLEFRPDGTKVYCGESVEFMSGEDAQKFLEAWDNRIAVTATLETREVSWWEKLLRLFGR